MLDAEFRKRHDAHWLAKLGGVLPVAPVLDLAQALDNPFLRATDMIRNVPHPRQARTCACSPTRSRSTAQRLEQAVCSPLGADNDDCLAGPSPTGEVGMKLEGIRVIDLSVFLPGPYLTLAMADHGAEVIKVEAPGEGDPGRHIGLSDGPSTVFFRNLNRGKKSVVLDLKDPARPRALLALCDTADVFVESFRPGRGRSPRRRLRRGARAQPAHRLLLDQRLRTGRRLSRPPGARSGAGSAEAACSA